MPSTIPATKPSLRPAPGALLNDAYESAGFVLHKGHPSRLAYRAEVAERIAELRALRTEAESHNPLALLASLQRIARAGEGSRDPALMKQARLALADAARLEARLARRLAVGLWNSYNDINGFSANSAGDAVLKGGQAPRQRPSSAHPAPIQRPSSAPRAPGNSTARSPEPPRQRHAVSPGAPRRLLPPAGALALTHAARAPTLGAGSDGRAVALSPRAEGRKVRAPR